MQIRRLFRSSILAALMILAGTFVSHPIMADPVLIQIGTATGTVDPITYTTAVGTFTTSSITLTLNTSSTSFFTVDQATGAITLHLVIDAAFNDGMGSDLMGTIIIDETGTLGPNPIPMDVQNGILLGAGSFNGTTMRGVNPLTANFPGWQCAWGFSEDPERRITIDLPAGFTNGTGIGTSGHLEGTAVPEPASLILLSSGLAGIGAVLRKRRRPC
jgi:hypothetical protein